MSKPQRYDEIFMGVWGHAPWKKNQASKHPCKQCVCVCVCVVWWCGGVVVWWCGGVVWCGVVWCGVVWCGVVWCGVVLLIHVLLKSYTQPSNDTVFYQ